MIQVASGLFTTANSYVKIKKEEKKNFLPFAAKFVPGLRALVVYTTRVLCVVLYFGVFLGLLDILAHWHADQIPRADDVNFTAPPYSIYTGHDITVALGVFTFLLFLQSLVILFLKRQLSTGFKEASWGAKLNHIVESINRQENYLDTDVILGYGFVIFTKQL